MIAKQIPSVFNKNQNIELGKKKIGESQPPKKHIEITADNHSIFEYSAKKNIAKVIEAYSTL
jgi:hypothetical protein